ncbi:GTPase ObgE [Candidatus Acetothermia bacterium]|nr:GTPase ObgE [Candidatus Acetothermia bacterium]MBI3461314.1 GTPase ObgE [Candidatus Acetothermia bacterium]MBI3659262.1 GTPase ObgE [Candidatus Acetothermia bacterium]
MFIDEAKICVIGGNGGDGLIGFRREKFRPKGGPDGGDGGRGANVILKASPHVNTLLQFKHTIHYRAESGDSGGKNRKHGADGQDLIIPVPVGTLVKDLRTQEILGDLSEPDLEIVIVRGGEGGRGNDQFKTSVRQAPRIREKGQPGEERWLKLELKLLADVGIIGFPNVGKSSLIAKISAARPKIAPYPFTTIVPNLGVVQVDEYRDFVIVDIPGLVEGAHAGKGLGDRFLKHVERTRVLVHLIDVASVEERDPFEDYETINQELKSFSEELTQKPQIVVGNKIDILDETQRQAIVRKFSEQGKKIHLISAATGEGTRSLVYLCYEKVLEMKQKEPARAPLDPELRRRRVYKLTGDPSWEVYFDGEVFHIEGQGVERLARLSLEEPDAQEYLVERLKAMGIWAQLVRQGLRPGSSVRIGKHEFTYQLADYEEGAGSLAPEEGFPSA